MQDGTVVAVKTIKSRGGSVAVESFEQEALVHQPLDHERIIKLYGFWKDTQVTQKKKKHGEWTYKDVGLEAIMALELAPNKELISLMMQTGAFSEPVARYYFKQMLEGIEYMHSEGIYHLDLKPDNMVLDEHFNVKICDFGLATKEEQRSSPRGTRVYMAPEMIREEEYLTSHADIYSLGIILYCLATGRPPFTEAGRNCKYARALWKKPEKYWKKVVSEGVNEPSDELKDLIETMLKPFPEERLAISQIKNHSWLQGECPDTSVIESNLIEFLS